MAIGAFRRGSYLALSEVQFGFACLARMRKLDIIPHGTLFKLGQRKRIRFCAGNRDFALTLGTTNNLSAMSIFVAEARTALLTTRFVSSRRRHEVY